MSLPRSIRASENLHIVFWLLKDVSWVLGWKALGIGMFVPTLALAIRIAWKSRGDIGELLHCVAVVFWISANGIWMIGEFWFDDSIRHLAVPFFIAGLSFVGWYYLVMLPRQARRGQRG